MLVFSQDEPAASARMARDFAKDHSNFVVRALVLEGKLLAADQLKAVASMPSRDEATGANDDGHERAGCQISAYFNGNLCAIRQSRSGGCR